MKDVVTFINEEIKSCLCRGEYYAVADYSETDGKRTPYIEAEGKKKRLYIPDKCDDIIIYHRCLSAATLQVPDRVSERERSITFNMVLICLSDLTIIEKTKEWIMLKVATAFPAYIGKKDLCEWRQKENIASAHIVPGNINADRVSVYRDEFGSINNLSKLSTSLFSMRYDIVIEKNCKC